MEEIGLFKETGFSIKIEREPGGAIRLMEDEKFNFLTHALAAIYLSQKYKNAKVYWYYNGKKLEASDGDTVKDLLLRRSKLTGKKISRSCRGRFFCPKRYKKPFCRPCEHYLACKSSDCFFE